MPITNQDFLDSLNSVHRRYEELIRMTPVDRAQLPKNRKLQCVYLFSEGSTHFYVGRTKDLRRRLKNHCGMSSAHNQAVFAFKLARHATNNVDASYSGSGTRKGLSEDPIFANAFLDAKARVRNMHLRFVEEPDALRQSLLEIYVAAILKTPFNDFDTH